MKKILLAVLFGIFSIPSYADYADWSDTDKKLFIASNVAIGLDWATTRDMSKRYNEGFYEKGPILKAIGGSHPSTSTVDKYFIGRLVANYLLADYFKEYRSVYLIITTADHGVAGIKNTQIGLRASF